MASGDVAARGEASTAAMTDAARRMLTALHAGEAENSPQVQALHAEFEAHWLGVREAAVALEAPPGPAASDAAEVESLRAERRELRAQLKDRNRALKDQIDMLRQLLLATQLSGGGA
jgi:hypothetical protein